MKTTDLNKFSYKKKYNLATDTKTPKEILAFFAKDIDSRIRGMVARNENTPVEVLDFLATDEKYEIRKGVAMYVVKLQATITHQ